MPLPKPRPAEAPAAEPDKPAADGNRTPADEPTSRPNRPRAAPPPPSACRLALTEAIAIAPSIPDIHGPGGCGGEDLVRLEAVVLPDKRRVAVKPAAILRCAMASAIADWVRTDIAPLAASLGSVISDLDNFDSFECRGRNRVVGAPLSEHGRANALDVRALKLANGQSISLTDRTVPRELRESVLHSVCARFSTVLGPGSDWYHEDHIHLDLMERHNNYKICQWNVWDPLPQIAPLLPAERPDEAPPREVAAKSERERRESRSAPTIRSGRAAGAADKPPTKKRRQTGAFDTVQLHCSVGSATACRRPPPCSAICEIERRVAVLRLEHHDDGADLHPAIEIDHVLVGHADAAGGNRRADIFRLVGAVNPEQRVLAARIEIERARTHRIVRARRHEGRNAEPLDFALGRMPGRPLGHAADLGDAGPGHGFLADGDAVADRLAVIEHVIEIVVVGIDHDRAGRFLAVILDDGAAERLGDRHVGVANLRQQFLVARLEVGLVGRLIGRGLHAARQHQAGGREVTSLTFSDDIVLLPIE